MKTLILFLAMTLHCNAATFLLTWLERPANEKIFYYNIYEDNRLIGKAFFPNYTAQVLTPGKHVYQVSAVNVWGEGVKSKAVTSPNVTGTVSTQTLKALKTRR